MGTLIAKKPEGGNFKQIKPGVYGARCYSIVDLGTQSKDFKGKIKEKRQIRITWEFPEELEVFDEAKGEQPFVLSNEYTLSLYEASGFRKDLESWLGRPLTPQEVAEGFDVETLIGKTCQIQVVEVPSKQDSSRLYAQISGIMSCPKSMTIPDAINPPLFFTIDEIGTSKFDNLPEFVKNKIKESKEYKEMNDIPEFSE